MEVIDHDKNTNDTVQPTSTLSVSNDSASQCSAFGSDFLSLLDGELEAMRGTNQKFSLNKHGMKNLFLPSLYECSECVIGMSFSKLIEFVEVQQGRQIRISRNSRSAMFNKGVGNPTAKKFVEWLKPALGKWAESMDKSSAEILNKGASDTTTAGDWLCLIAGMSASKAFKDPYVASEYHPLFEFLKERCNTNIEMTNVIRGERDDGRICAEKPSEVFKVMRPYCERYSIVPEAELNNYDRCLILNEEGQLDGESKLSLFRSYFHIYLDFFLHIFASYEVGLVITYAENRDVLLTKKGIFCRALTRFIKKYNSKEFSMTFFGELLEEIRDVISKECGEISIREMSKSLPLVRDSTNPSKESDADRYYKKLKSWKNGNEFPSMESVEKFLDNLTEDIGQENNVQLTQLCMTALWLDKEISKWRALLDNSKELDAVEPVMNGLYAAIGRYEVYYLHHLHKHINRNAGV